ncbi:hypothetical protein UCRPA7_8355 [Phaeoacremonium minimum UCRPA7]|uniref:Uncharacterized protein n=1 Tax=Phaeoacremonium minimum (strain UCR-PA7) TaxID=1286976 RepID=R8BA31_PHAM7|nr:hypothetical protein UCRPA7_8355 [Phaeoacremonium minimum UCRPA7]EON96136.1 hypothetical protein UCRPA7_8355 [Phaeoacremonium minimum UCRPA7]
MDMDLSWVYPVSSAIATTFTTTFAVLSTITIYALRIVIWPISILYGAFLVVFAPVIYTLQFLFAPVFYFMSLVPNLKPLYIYFGSAAFVGIVAGLMLQLTSTTFVSLFSMDQGQDESMRYPRRLEARLSMKLLDDASSQDSDWQWLDKAAHPNMKRKRRAPGLTAQTILEEDDDSE